MKNKYKMLVLSDLNETTSSTIKSSISFAKIIKADINFFYVKKPTEVIEKESQLSAMRTINKEYFSIDKKIKTLIEPISREYNTPINHTFAIGNIKNEIVDYLDKNNPDIVLLGRRKNKIINFMGDRITEFVLKKFKGLILIADDKNCIEPDKEISLGVFNSTNTNSVFVKNIIDSTEKPLKFFKILENSTTLKKESFLDDKKTVEYIFERNNSIIKNISNYLSKNNINLVLVERDKNNKNLTESKIKDVIKNLDCSLILTP